MRWACYWTSVEHISGVARSLRKKTPVQKRLRWFCIAPSKAYLSASDLHE